MIEHEPTRLTIGETGGSAEGTIAQSNIKWHATAHDDSVNRLIHGESVELGDLTSGDNY